VKSGYQLFVKGIGGFAERNVRTEVPSKTEFNRRTEAAFPCSLCII
jgi:hypothetical protein